MDPEIKIARDSARHHMTSRVPVIADGKTVRDAQKLIEEGVRHFDTVNYVYIVDDKNVFKNVLSVKELFRHEPSTELKAVPKKENLISVKPATDQEKTVYAALKNNIKAVPVVDEDGALLGVVPNEAILKILYKETREDLLQLAGIHSGAIAYEDELGTPVLVSFKHRMPWLLLGLFGGVFAAYVVGFFKNTIEENVILAAFIPLMAYMSNAVAIQVQTLFIRELATVYRLPLGKYVLHQLSVSALVAIAASAITFGITLAGFVQREVAFVISTSMFAAILVATLLALFVPLALKKFGSDPAIGSGPFSTALQDILSIVIYLGIASWLL